MKTLRHRVAAELVRLVPPHAGRDGWRIGTIVATEAELIQALGPPYDPGADGKVTRAWMFHTPRGFVTVRDYWWNMPEEWSIGGTDPRAVRWLRRKLEATLGRRLRRFDRCDDSEAYRRDLRRELTAVAS